MFERDGKVGGRARTAPLFGGEEGAEFLLGSESALQSLLKRLRIRCEPIQESSGVLFRGHYAAGTYRTVARQILPRKSAEAADRVLALAPHYSRHSRASASRWLRSQLHGDNEAMAFLQMILAGETCAPLSHVNVRSLLGCLHSDSWYRIRGGTERLAKILRAKSRMTLNLRTHVYAVRKTGAGVTVRWTKGGRRYQAGFDGVIIAAPEADRLVGRKSSGHFHSYVSVLLQYRRPWWNEENPSLSRGFITGFYTDGPLNYIQQASRAPRGRRTLRILLPDAHRKLAWTDGRIRDFYVTALRNISSLAERPAQFRITRWRHGLPCGRRKDKAERVSGRVCLAGDRFGEWPSMNAAIVSGKQAARFLSAELKQAQIAPSQAAQRFGVSRPAIT